MNDTHEIPFYRSLSQGLWISRPPLSVGDGPITEICSTELRRMVNIPETCTKFTAVFSKKPIAGSFRIKRPITMFINFKPVKMSKLEGVTACFYYTTREVLARAYAKNYRWVRAEYE